MYAVHTVWATCTYYCVDCGAENLICLGCCVTCDYMYSTERAVLLSSHSLFSHNFLFCVGTTCTCACTCIYVSICEYCVCVCTYTLCRPPSCVQVNAFSTNIAITDHSCTLSSSISFPGRGVFWKLGQVGNWPDHSQAQHPV